MKIFFRKLPLSLKLLLIGIVPVLFLLYFSVMIYREKSQTVNLLGNYIEHVEQSQNIAELINELAWERRFSYLKLIKDTSYNQIKEHRAKVDSIMLILLKSKDLVLHDFTKYTFLDNLASTRAAIDTIKNYPPNAVIQFYTDAIFRINTLKSIIPANTLLKPVYQDLIAQKTLSELITYLGIIRMNIFNVLYTKKFIPETLFGTLGVYKVTKTYETEFLLKASAPSVKLYQNKKNSTDYKAVMDYIDKVFATFKLDSAYTADEWWNVSSNALNVLRTQQRNLWKTVDTKIKQAYQNEVNAKNASIVFLLLAVLFVIAFVTFVILQIEKLLGSLKEAATKIAKGETGLQLEDMPNGIVGDLANCITEIDKNNVALAEAANEIGKGNFNVEVTPRSNEDLLGISIKKMQQDLLEYASRKDEIQKETEDLVYKRDEFFSIASHELKTPVTSLKAYTQLMLMDAREDSSNKNMLQRMDLQIHKLTTLINDLLDTSRLDNGHLIYHKEAFLLKDLVSEVIEDVTITSHEHEILFNPVSNTKVFADRDRIGQVISNFLTNAIKYAPDGKKIIVSLKKEDHKVVCAVTDFGKGIAAAEQNKIFERFYRISGHNLNTFPGLGLGLFICKEIIENHGGKIGLESEQGKGSTFFFELPVN